MFTKNLLILISVFCLAHLILSDNADCPTIKTKSQWGGRLAKEVVYQVRPIRFVAIHHTTTDDCRNFVDCAEIIQNIQTYHMNDLDLNDIGYNFLIGNDGVVYEGTGWGVRGAHTYGYNMNGTGIAFIGNYQRKLPSSAALEAAKKLLSCGVKLGELDKSYSLFGGLQAISTKSPGLTLYNEIQEWPNWVSRL